MCRAARAFAPRTCSRRPNAVRDIRNQTTIAAAPAIKTPTWIRVPGMAGSIAAKSRTLVCGTLEEKSWNGPLMRIPARLMPMNVIISVVMISFSS